MSVYLDRHRSAYPQLLLVALKEQEATVQKVYHWSNLHPKLPCAAAPRAKDGSKTGICQRTVVSHAILACFGPQSC